MQVILVELHAQLPDEPAEAGGGEEGEREQYYQRAEGRNHPFKEVEGVRHLGNRRQRQVSLDPNHGTL